LIHVAIVAQNMALRVGLRSLLTAAGSIEVTGEASDLEGIKELFPGIDVIVLALTSLVDESSLSMHEEGLADGESYPALLLLIEELEVNPIQHVPSQLWGVLPLDATPEELRAAITALAEGLLVGAPHLVEVMFRGIPLFEERQELGLRDKSLEPLTQRESEVLQLLAQGLANKQIAVSLGISEHTVKFHVSSIYSKLSVSSRTEAVSVGARLGLVVL
jgi:two-component system, NarL family, response regulator YdfI